MVPTTSCPAFPASGLMNMASQLPSIVLMRGRYAWWQAILPCSCHNFPDVDWFQPAGKSAHLSPPWIHQPRREFRVRSRWWLTTVNWWWLTMMNQWWIYDDSMMTMIMEGSCTWSPSVDSWDSLFLGGPRSRRLQGSSPSGAHRSCKSMKWPLFQKFARWEWQLWSTIFSPYMPSLGVKIFILRPADVLSMLARHTVGVVAKGCSCCGFGGTTHKGKALQDKACTAGNERRNHEQN